MKYFKSGNIVTVPGWRMNAISVSRDTLAEAAEWISKPGVYFVVGEGRCHYEPENMAEALRVLWEQQSVAPQQPTNSQTEVQQQQHEDQQPSEAQQLEDRHTEDQEQHEEQEPEEQQPTEQQSAETEGIAEEVAEAVEATGSANSAESVATAICFTSFDSELQGKRILNLLGLLGYMRLHLDMGHLHAEGAERPDGFVVYAGALVKRQRSEAFAEAYSNVNWDGSVGGFIDGTIGVLKEDIVLSSASEAAKFVSGYKNMSGPVYWKDEKGRCLKELRDRSVCLVCKEGCCR